MDPFSYFQYGFLALAIPFVVLVIIARLFKKEYESFSLVIPTSIAPFCAAGLIAIKFAFYLPDGLHTLNAYLYLFITFLGALVAFSFSLVANKLVSDHA
jgi:hypothetical protein